MLKFVKGLVRDKKGQGMVEYALILALVSIISIAALRAMGLEINTLFSDIVTALRGA